MAEYVIGQKTKDGMALKMLKLVDSQLHVYNSENGSYNTIKGGNGKTVYPSFTFPIPYDKNNDTLTLVVDISEQPFINEEYTDNDQNLNSYVRINMSQFKEDMKIIMNGEFLSLPEQGIGMNFYGQLVSFQLNENMYPNFNFDKIYYGRYAWFDTENTCSDWNGFSFSSDVVDFSPISIKQKEQVDIYDGGNLTSETTIDYLNGNIQKFIIEQSITLAITDIKNIPYGQKLTLFITNKEANTFILKDDKKTKSYNKAGQYLLTIYNIDYLILQCQELLSQNYVEQQKSLQVYISGYADGKWSIDNGQTWYENGDTLLLQPQLYTVTFLNPNQEITDNTQDTIIPPMPIYVDLREVESKVITGIYQKALSNTGYIRITSNISNSRWSYDGGTTWCKSGQDVQVNIGEYTIIFEELYHYFAPESCVIQVTNNVISAHSVVYSEAYYLTVNSNIDTLEIWSINNYHYKKSGEKLKLSRSNYTITFRQLYAYTQPSSLSVTITHGTEKIITAEYIKQAGEYLQEYIYESQPAGDKIIYVDIEKRGTGSGDSFGNATTFTNAIGICNKRATRSNYQNDLKTIIFMKGGQYSTVKWNVRCYTNVQIYGGFTNNGTWESRQPIANPTIINGDNLTSNFIHGDSSSKITLDGIKFIGFKYQVASRLKSITNCQFQNIDYSYEYLTYYINLIRNCSFININSRNLMKYTKELINSVFINTVGNIQVNDNESKDESIINCQFINVTEGTISSSNNIQDCLFVNICAKISCKNMDNTTILNSKKTTFQQYDSIISNYCTNIKNCHIINNYGIIALGYNGRSIYNTQFINCQFGTISYSGNVYVVADQYEKFYNCNFVRCNWTADWIAHSYCKYSNCLDVDIESDGGRNNYVYRADGSGITFAQGDGKPISTGEFNKWHDYFIEDLEIANNNQIDSFIQKFGNWQISNQNSPLCIDGKWCGCYDNNGFITMETE